MALALAGAEDERALCDRALPAQRGRRPDGQARGQRRRILALPSAVGRLAPPPERGADSAARPARPIRAEVGKEGTEPTDRAGEQPNHSAVAERGHVRTLAVDKLVRLASPQGQRAEDPL